MSTFEVIGLLALGAGGALVAWIGLRNDPRLIRAPWERAATTALGVSAWVIAAIMLMGII